MRQWLCLSAQGYTDEDSSKKIGISTTTIDRYKKRIKKKLIELGGG
jgi:DNA-binding CsgD family transcriptional regulator